MTRQRNRQLWTLRLKRYRLFGQTIVDLCRTEEVSQADFYYWKKRLGDQAMARSEDSPADADPIPPANAQPQFAEVALQKKTNADFDVHNASPPFLSTARLTNGIQIEPGTGPCHVRRIVA